MSLFDVLMNFGTLMAALATLPQIWAVWRNRDALAGYNPLASFALFLAMCSFAAAFAIIELWASVLCEVPVAAFWLMASAYSWRRKLR